MKIILGAVLFAACIAIGITLDTSYSLEKGVGPSRYEWSCDIKRNVSREYRTAIYEFIVNTYKVSTARSKYNVIFAPASIWLILAAVAEGTSPNTQERLFKVLYLPEDPCLRQKYYEMASSIILPGPDVDVINTRVLTVDEGLKLKPDWLKFVKKHSLLQVVSASIKENPEHAVRELRRVLSSETSNINVDGNSVLLDAVDFNGLWTTAFSDKIIERAPFYNAAGQQIGVVDLMTLRAKVRMGYMPTLQGKALELPLGADGRYFIIFVLVSTKADANSLVQNMTGDIIYEAIETMRDSEIPIDVAIPRFTMSSEIDMKEIMGYLGVPDIWTDSAATRPISEPGILPSSFIQRATITFSNAGVNPAPYSPASPPNAPTGLDPRVGREFRADRPFLYAVFDRKTGTCVMTSAYSVPTYSL